MRVVFTTATSIATLLTLCTNLMGVSGVMIDEYSKTPPLFFDTTPSPAAEPTQEHPTLPPSYEMLLPKIASDDPEASYFLGTVYEDDYDPQMPGDLKEAYLWYSFAQVIWNEKSEYIDSLAISQKIEKILEKLAEKGLTPPTYNEHTKWLENRVKEGSAVAMVLLSDQFNAQGKSKEAILLLKAGADKKNGLALLKLGAMHKGQEALDFYMKAYNLGEKIAAHYIGSLLEKMEGPSQKAVAWHQKAAEQYDSKNKKYLREAIDQKRYIKSLTHLVDLAEKGNAFASTSLQALVAAGIIEGEDSEEEDISEKEMDRNTSPTLTAPPQ